MLQFSYINPNHPTLLGVTFSNSLEQQSIHQWWTVLGSWSHCYFRSYKVYTVMKLLIDIFPLVCWMTIPEDISNRSRRFFGKRMLLVIIIILIAGLTFGVWFLFISGSDNAPQSSDVYLPPNCYSVNGKQTCSPPKS